MVKITQIMISIIILVLISQGDVFTDGQGEVQVVCSSIFIIIYLNKWKL